MRMRRGAAAALVALAAFVVGCGGGDSGGGDSASSCTLETAPLLPIVTMTEALATSSEAPVGK